MQDNYHITENKSYTWTWFRSLLKIIEDYKQINFIVEKVQSSFIEYLGYLKTEIFIVENPESGNEKNYVDKLASSQFFSREVIEDIFLHKKPCKLDDKQIIFPLECEDRTLGLLYIQSANRISEEEYDLLWSFCDHLAIRVNELQMPVNIDSLSKSKIKEISNSIFNNLKSFLEASLERLKVLEEQNIQLVELNKTRTELINNVSHELRTPLVSIMGFSNLLQRHEPRPDLIKEASEQIQSAGSRLSRMIDDLIQLNRASTRGWEIVFEKLDIGEIAKFVTNTLSPLNQEHNFTFNYLAEYPLIQADRKLLRQVIENLLINAIKYSPDGGEINCSITIDDKKQELYFAIKDNGIGMTKEENDRVFERFYRAKNPKTENIPGLGLGLSICRDVIEALAGKITCESEFGKGSVFTITFSYGN